MEVCSERNTNMILMKSKMKKEFPFRIDEKLKFKLDMLVEQLNKKDVWILLTGDEGSGKSNAASYLMYYFHCATGRDFSVDRFYFDSEELFNYAKTTKEQLLLWDEAALGGLSTEWWTQSQTNLIKLSITGRKLHHVFILCIPRFDKLKLDLRSERIHAQIHMDCGKRNDRYGHYIYLTRRGVSYLNYLWKTKKLRLYGQAMRKSGGFAGNIPFVFDKVLSAEDQQKYEDKKDLAIASIGKKKTPEKEDGDKEKMRKELREFKGKIARLKTPITSYTQIAVGLGIGINTLYKWRMGVSDEDSAKGAPSSPSAEG